ncbi:MAG: tRNA pseudouridine(55) synthase TruB [Fimbriimonadaceae bacterium]|nr:tRNA pseudouridine(55) synthase TruB [Fimbriimonadaceae bacterium]
MDQFVGRNDGVLLLDKPLGKTSHDLVASCRRLIGIKKIGHAGTLDPMATGLMILGIGQSTRLLTYLVGLDKEYFATVRLGATTISDDADSPIENVVDKTVLHRVTELQIRDAASKFVGRIKQVPSSVSAVKVGGKRAYAKVRAGEAVELEPREVTVSAFEIIRCNSGEFIDVDIRVECSSGTYIRALARDLGRALGVGGHLVALMRSKVGPFRVDEATTLDSNQFRESILPPAEVARRVMTSIEISAPQATELSFGRKIAVPGEDAVVAAIDPFGDLVGILNVLSGTASPTVIFRTGEGN